LFAINSPSKKVLIYSRLKSYYFKGVLNLSDSFSPFLLTESKLKQGNFYE
jgi:hypothetical protein